MYAGRLRMAAVVLCGMITAGCWQAAMAQVPRIPLLDAASGTEIPWWTMANGGVADNTRGGTIRATAGLLSIGRSTYTDDNSGGIVQVYFGYWLPSTPSGSGVGTGRSLTHFMGSLRSWPNPFQGSATIGFNLSQAATVTMQIVSSLGEPVATLAQDARLAAGEHRISWDGADRNGSAVASGIYFCRIDIGSAGSPTESAHIILHVTK